MMEKLFQHPGWLKVFAVALALLLWGYVMPQYTADTTKTFDIPLTVIKNPAMEVVDGPQDQKVTVQVSVEGSKLIVNRLGKDDLTALVDYRTITDPAKRTQVDVQVQGPPKTQLKLSVNPKSFAVTLAEITTITVPVVTDPGTGTLTLNGRDYQYTATAEQDKIQVTGRSDYLAQVKQVKLSLDPNTLKPDTNKIMLQSVPLDADGNPVPKLTGPQVAVDLQWTLLPPGKPFTVQAQTKGALPPGLVVASVEVQPATLTVRAATEDGTLPAQAVILTEPVDLTGKTGSFTATAKVVPPPGTTVAVGTVTVKINVQEATIEKLFKGVPVTGRSAPAGEQVSFSVTDVQVSVKGRYSALTPLDQSSISAYVDLEGLKDGKHTLPVRVAAPPGITEVGTDPPTIDVTISTQ